MAMLLCAWWSNSGPGYRQVADRTQQKALDGSTGEPGAVRALKKYRESRVLLFGVLLKNFCRRKFKLQ